MAARLIAAALAPLWRRREPAAVPLAATGARRWHAYRATASDVLPYDIRHKARAS